MTVRAAAKFVDVSVELGVPPALLYGVSFYVTISDDEISVTQGHGLIQVQVPASLSQKKADQFVRQGIVDALLVGSFYNPSGLTIDPDDIYIPFSAR